MTLYILLYDLYIYIYIYIYIYMTTNEIFLQILKIPKL